MTAILPLSSVKRWFSTPNFPDPERTRQAQLLARLLMWMALLALIGALASFMDERNSIGVTVTFYGLVWLGFGLVFAVVRTGRVVLSAWVFSLFFWSLIAYVTLTMGGLQGQNASTFAVCTLLIGSIMGGRAALVIACLSSVWCALVAYLELHDLLPRQLGPYTPINAWGAVTCTVLLTTVLLHMSLQSVRKVHADAQRSAAERDAALRRSIQGQKMELVGNLTSGIAHDLNNLLTVIVSASDVLRTQVSGADEENLAVLDDLEGAASRASLMTRQLLTFGRPRSNENEPVEMHTIVANMGNMLPRVLGASLSVNVNLETNCWVMASRTGLEQILLNLAVNARDAMPDGGAFSLELRGHPEHIILTAKDTGVGMDPEVQSRLFEPFFTTKTTGTGLGLATVRQLVEHFGGQIRVKSAVGQGTTFELTFPRSVDALVASQKPRVVPNQDKALRILLVDDDPLVRSSLSRLLARDNYDVLAVANGSEALAVLAVTPDLHCVVSDVAMPRMDGETLARRIEQVRPDLPMVLISGNREPLFAAHSGVRRAFVTKPVAWEDLRRALQQVTQSEQLQRAQFGPTAAL